MEQHISGNSHIAEVGIGAVQIGWTYYGKNITPSIRGYIRVLDDSNNTSGGWGVPVFEGGIVELIERLKASDWFGVTA